MLCLSRKKNERIVIIDEVTGERLTVNVNRIKYDKGELTAVLGIEASQRFKIYREEVLKAIEKEIENESEG